MKKVIGLVLALALALTMAIAASADLSASSIEEVQADVQQVLADLSAQFSPEELSAAVKDGLALLPIPADGVVDAADLPANAGEVLAAEIVAKLGLEGTDIAGRLTSAMSNDFVSFLAQMYVDVPTPPVTEVIPPKSGDSSVIAIATFAALSVAAGAAFVCLKKKED